MSKASAIRIGILGLGTVGCGTIDVLRRNANEISGRVGSRVEIVAASARDITKPRAVSLDGVRLAADPYEVVRADDVDIVVELIGGTDPALDLVTEALKQGKQVVTANKALIALHGNEVFDAAAGSGAMVAFEAAVAGGIPIIKAIRESLAGNRVEWLAGIINGTCNYMLTAMTERSGSFDDVLKRAQDLGYAEADPSFDIDGVDAAHKLTILASIAFGIPLNFQALYVEGIGDISLEDVGYAQALGYRVKHLGIARLVESKIELRVHPTLVPARHPLASVNDVMNAVMIRGDAVGDVLLSGAGAGAEPTASSVVADIIDVARAITCDPDNRVPHLAFRPEAVTAAPIAPMSDVISAYYLRMLAVDRPGVLAEVTKILGDRGISIEAIQQQEPAAGATTVPIVILSHRVAEGAMVSAIEAIENLHEVEGRVTRIRMESFA